MVVVLLVIVMIVIIIGLYRSNWDLKEENEKLKKGVWNYCPHCGNKLNKSSDNYNFSNNDMKIEINYDNKSLYKRDKHLSVSQKNHYTDMEIKNSAILITGAVLIILGAIIFLTSTWYTTLNFVKTIVIILMLFVFLIASNIAEKVLKLKQTATAFYYIALSYLPIALMSIALFGLFGKFFSIYGLGRYIYLAVCSGVISYIYYQSAKKKESILLVIASVLFQILFAGFLILIFTHKISFVLIGLIIYNLILHFMYTSHKVLFNDNVHLKIINIITIALGVIVIYFNFFWYIAFSFNIWNFFLIIIFSFNIFYSLVKVNKMVNMYYSIYPAIIIIIFFHFANLSEFNFNFIIKQLCMMISVLIIYVYDLLRFSKIKITSFIFVSV